MEEQKPLSIGDLVIHKTSIFTGGLPAMVVFEIETSDSRTPLYAWCRWYVGNAYVKEKFRVEELQISIY
jgi:uncharacterized protein YodC (DUF2158 family)